MRKYLAVLLILLPASLPAQSGEFWAEGGTSILVNRSIGTPIPGGTSDAVSLDDGFRVGFRFDYNSAGNLGHEVQYAYNRSALSDSTGVLLGQIGSSGMAIHQLNYNLLYYLRPTRDEAKVRPFFTAGAGLDSFSTPSSANPRGGSARFAFNYGGGVKYRLSPLFGLRFDVRGYDSGKPNWRGILSHQSGLLQQFETSVGFGVFF